MAFDFFFSVTTLYIVSVNQHSIRMNKSLFLVKSHFTDHSALLPATLSLLDRNKAAV